MSRLSAVLIVCATLSATTGLAHAGACADQITQLRQAAQLDHEPTPKSVEQAQTYVQLIFAAELTQAEAQGALGHEPRSRLVKARQAAKVLAEVDAKHDNAHGSAPSRSENQNR
jgi:hypothetical protein